MGSSRYSVEFKRAVVEKLLNRGTRGVTAILEEAGISSPTLYQWKADFANIRGGSTGKARGGERENFRVPCNQDSMKNKDQRPQNRSPEEKLNALIAFENLSFDLRGAFLRKEGLL